MLTQEQIAAAKAACRVKFGHDRLVGCKVAAPINIMAAVAAFNLKEADAHEAARERSAIDARSALLASRCLAPDAAALAKVREQWPAVDTLIETEFMVAMGFGVGDASCLPLSVSSAPRGFAPLDQLDRRVAEAYQDADGAKLWAITSQASGLALVVRNPVADVWTAGCLAIEAGRKAGTVLSSLVGFYSDHLVWCPTTLAAHLDERPGRARDLLGPWTEMGGAAATGSHTFL